MSHRTLSSLTLALSLMLNPLAAAACTDPLPPSLDEGASVSVGRMAGLTWVAVMIAGERVPDRADIWFSVTSDGKVTGRSGCNTYGGEAELDAGTIIMRSMMMTEMACMDEAAMAREAAYLKALAEVASFAVTPEGFLYLSRADGTVAVCFRP